MADKTYLYVEITKRNKAKAKRMAKNADLTLRQWVNKLLAELIEK
jgi:hypothetical protein